MSLVIRKPKKFTEETREDNEPKVDVEGDSEPDAKKTKKRSRRKRLDGIKCPDCDVELEIREGVKKIKNRRCERCKKLKRLKKPESILASLAKAHLHYLGKKDDKELGSVKTMKKVLKKYDNKCILTGEDDITRLRLVFFKPGLDVSARDWVLVSKDKARKIRKIEDAYKRRAVFPPDAQIVIIKDL